MALHRGLEPVSLEGGPHPAPGPMEEDALVALADLERLADLLGGPALDVPQAHDEALGGGKVRAVKIVVQGR